jgi:hypothetical protein
MLKLEKFGFAVLMFTVVACGKSAVPIPGVVGTGIDEAGQPLPNGVADRHYVMSKHPDDPRVGPVVFVVHDTQAPISTGDWVLNDVKSKWVGPMPDGTSTHPTGEYRYRLEFDLTGFDTTTAELRGRWATDNAGIAIVLNNVATGVANDLGPNKFSDEFVITTGFRPNKNIMEFVVSNSDDQGMNPSGLRVEISGHAKRK